MKKYLLLSLCLILTLALSSCKKETLVRDSSNRTILTNIYPNDWKVSSDGKSYSAVISVPENDSYFNDNGTIVVAMSFEDVQVYEALPQVFQGYSYRFTTEPGFVTIYLNDPYGDVPTKPTFESTAKVTLIDSEVIN